MKFLHPYWHYVAVALSVAGCSIWVMASAWAAGSMGLDEVLQAVAKSPKLVAEIQQELTKSNIKMEDVGCTGARHGNQWIYLGGGRAAPYECKIGQRAFNIEADRVYFDARGKSLGDVNKADQKRAKTFRESNFRWIWIAPRNEVGDGK